MENIIQTNDSTYNTLMETCMHSAMITDEDFKTDNFKLVRDNLNLDLCIYWALPENKDVAESLIQSLDDVIIAGDFVHTMMEHFGDIKITELPESTMTRLKKLYHENVDKDPFFNVFLPDCPVFENRGGVGRSIAGALLWLLSDVATDNYSAKNNIS